MRMSAQLQSLGADTCILQFWQFKGQRFTVWKMFGVCAKQLHCLLFRHNVHRLRQSAGAESRQYVLPGQLPGRHIFQQSHVNKF